MPNKEERTLLKSRYALLKELYRNLRKEITTLPYDSPEYYDVVASLEGVMHEIAKLRAALFENSTLKQYLNELGNFIFLGEKTYKSR